MSAAEITRRIGRPRGDGAPTLITGGAGFIGSNLAHRVLSAGRSVVILDNLSRAGVEHNVVNTSRAEPLRLYTIYSPAEHPDGTVHRTKAEADAYERAHGH